LTRREQRRNIELDHRGFDPLRQRLTSTALIAAIMMVTPVAEAWAADFSAYPAEIYQGPVIQPGFRGAQRAYANYRARIRASAADGPRFGGHYAMAVIGCGASCRFGFVTDLKTGLVYDLPLGGEEYPALLYRARPGSRLLQSQWEVSGKDGGPPSCVFQDFLWTGKTFRPLTAPRSAECLAWDDAV
jgi:hypothetical protein